MSIAKSELPIDTAWREPTECRRRSFNNRVDTLTHSRRIRPTFSSPAGASNGLYLNRTGQLFLDDGAYQMARSAFERNVRLSEERSPGLPTLNRFVASLGLARTELLVSLPDTGERVFDGPRQRRQRTEARREAAQRIRLAQADLQHCAGRSPSGIFARARNECSPNATTGGPRSTDCE